MEDRISGTNFTLTVQIQKSEYIFHAVVMKEPCQTPELKWFMNLMRVLRYTNSTHISFLLQMALLIYTLVYEEGENLL